MSSEYVAENESELDGVDGISEEERREVAAQIERIAEQSRIERSPELFRFKGSRKSGALPLAANLIGLILMAGGVLGGYHLFQQQEAEIAESTGTFSTAEGRLIAEIRRQAREELDNKDGQIASVQRELTDVRVERDQVLAEIEERVAEREAELRLALTEELAAERARLLEAGVTEPRANERIRELENERTAENAVALAEYRQELADEYESTLAQLRVLQREYEAELAALQRERLAIARESESREQEVREELDERQAEEIRQAEQAEGGAPVAVEAPESDPVVDPEAQANIEALDAARAELARLSESAEQESLIESQISGLYADVAEHVATGNYERAIGSIATLRRLLSEPAVTNLGGIQERIDVDLAVIRVIEDLIGQQQAFLEEQAALAQDAVAREAAASESEQAANVAADREASAQALAELNGELEQREALIEELERELDALQSELSTAQSQLARSIEREAVARQEAAGARAAREAVRDEQSTAGVSEVETALAESVAELREQVAALEPANIALQNDNIALGVRIERLTAQSERFGEVAASYRALVARYRAYADREREILANETVGALAEAKLEFDAFLTSEAVSAAFPNLFERVSRYERAIEAEAGQRAILELIDVVYNLNALDTLEARQAFLEEERSRVNDESFMGDLLSELFYLLEGG
ncbi:MAG: hypothetical protein ACOC8L_05445 [Spirochaetota bacterium]